MKKMYLPFLMAFAAVFLSGYSLIGQGGEEVRDLDTFNGIGVAISADVYYTPGNSPEIRIVGDEDDIRDLITEVRDGVLQIKYDSWRSRHSKLTLYITSRELELVKISGSADFMVKETLNSDEMELGLSGSGSIQMKNLRSDEVEVRISGSGSLEIEQGAADELDVSISGSGKLMAEGFEVSECDVSISGSGNVRIGVGDELNAKLSGSGRVYYRGSPRVNSVSSGSGKVQAI